MSADIRAAVAIQALQSHADMQFVRISDWLIGGLRRRCCRHPSQRYKRNPPEQSGAQPLNRPVAAYAVIKLTPTFAHDLAITLLRHDYKYKVNSEEAQT